MPDYVGTEPQKLPEYAAIAAKKLPSYLTTVAPHYVPTNSEILPQKFYSDESSRYYDDGNAIENYNTKPVDYLTRYPGYQREVTTTYTSNYHSPEVETGAINSRPISGVMSAVDQYSGLEPDDPRRVLEPSFNNHHQAWYSRTRPAQRRGIIAAERDGGGGEPERWENNNHHPQRYYSAHRQEKYSNNREEEEEEKENHHHYPHFLRKPFKIPIVEKKEEENNNANPEPSKNLGGAGGGGGGAKPLSPEYKVPVDNVNVFTNTKRIAPRINIVVTRTTPRRKKQEHWSSIDILMGRQKLGFNDAADTAAQIAGTLSEDKSADMARYRTASQITSSNTLSRGKGLEGSNYRYQDKQIQYTNLIKDKHRQHQQQQQQQQQQQPVSHPGVCVY